MRSLAIYVAIHCIQYTQHMPYNAHCDNILLVLPSNVPFSRFSLDLLLCASVATTHSDVGVGWPFLMPAILSLKHVSTLPFFGLFTAESERKCEQNRATNLV